MAPSAHGIDAVRAWLDERAVSYEVIEHDATFSAVEESEATGVPSGFTAKTLVLHDRAGYLLAVIPASRRLDEHRMRELLGATAHLRLATEEEMGREFPGFDIGRCPRSARSCRRPRSSTSACSTTTVSSAPGATTAIRSRSTPASWSGWRSPGWRTSASARNPATTRTSAS